MRDDEDVVGCGHRDDALGLGDASNPSNVWLKNINTATTDELAEAISCVLVLGCGEENRALERIFDCLVSVVVILITRE